MAGTAVQHRRGTAAQWAAANPVLPDGELGYEKDTGIVKVGNGSSTWNQLSPILGSSYLPLLGKAYDSERLDGLDSTAFLTKEEAVTAYASLATLTGRDRGSGTTWPTADNRRGDHYYHTAVSQLGIYNGTAWRLIGSGTVATITARNALTWTYSGLQVQVTADGLTYEYQNTFVGWTRPWDAAWGELQVALLTSGQVATATYVSYGAATVAVTKGRKLRLRGRSYWYTASSSAVTVQTRIMVYRDVNATPTTVVLTGGDNDRRIGGGGTLDIQQFTYDAPYTTGGTLGGSVNTRFELQGKYGAAPSSPMYLAGNPEQNFLALVDVGPATAPPSS